MARSPEPLWRVLRKDLDKAGYSVRGFARMCHDKDPRQTWDSWKRTLTRALDDDADKPYAPSRETAELWAGLLGKPADRYVRQQARETIREENLRLRQERVRLLEENEELRQEIARLEAAGGRWRQGRSSNG